MRSKWRKHVDDGRLRGQVKKAAPPGPNDPGLERSNRRSKRDRFAFTHRLVAQHEGHTVAPRCRRYAVAPSGFYARRKRQNNREEFIEFAFNLANALGCGQASSLD
jgi:hypothetical protein